MPIGRRALIARIVDGLIQCGFRPVGLYDPEQRPMRLVVANNGTTLKLVIYAWRCTRGGPTGVRRGDEWRVQTTRPQGGPLVQRGGSRTLLVGYWEEGD